jgi:hypothetical protein
MVLCGGDNHSSMCKSSQVQGQEKETRQLGWLPVRLAIFYI